jgi:hypothetical protein
VTRRTSEMKLKNGTGRARRSLEVAAEPGQPIYIWLPALENEQVLIFHAGRA